MSRKAELNEKKCGTCKDFMDRELFGGTLYPAWCGNPITSIIGETGHRHYEPEFGEETLACGVHNPK